MALEKRKERYWFKNTGGNSYQFPKTGAGHPESRFRASPRILEPGQISRSRYRHAESNLRASPCDLEIERQNTDSKFRDSSFCLRSCTHASSTDTRTAQTEPPQNQPTHRLARARPRPNRASPHPNPGTHASWGVPEFRMAAIGNFEAVISTCV